MFGNVHDHDNTTKYWDAFLFIMISVTSVGYGNTKVIANNTEYPGSDYSTFYIMFLMVNNNELLIIDLVLRNDGLSSGYCDCSFQTRKIKLDLSEVNRRIGRL